MTRTGSPASCRSIAASTGRVWRQLMQACAQKPSSTTRPRRSAGSSGRSTFSQTASVGRSGARMAKGSAQGISSGISSPWAVARTGAPASAIPLPWAPRAGSGASSRTRRRRRRRRLDGGLAEVERSPRPGDLAVGRAYAVLQVSAERPAVDRRARQRDERAADENARDAGDARQRARDDARQEEPLGLAGPERDHHAEAGHVHGTRSSPASPSVYAVRRNISQTAHLTEFPKRSDGDVD